MNTIVFDRIEFRNFLSFGNTWQTFNILPGITLIQGYDKNTKKSNGSGKTSLLELVPFALYGQTIKNVKKNKIPNWINKSKCEVKLYFHINDDKYYFYRSIKPNKFIIEKNDEIIPQLSNVRDFQSFVNTEIIGMDFNTFRNLEYLSPNDTISIIDSSKDKKRKFLESLFDLSEYSQMMKICNPKINSYNTKIDVMNNSIIHIKKRIEDLKKDIENYVSVDINSYKRNLNLKKMRLEGLLENTIQFDEKEYLDTKNRLLEYKNDYDTYVNNINDLKVKIESVNMLLADINISDSEDKIKCIDSEIDKINEELSNLEILDTKNQKEEIQSISNDIKPIELRIDHLNKINYALEVDKDNLLSEIKDIDDDSLSEFSNCPLCHQKIDHNKIDDYIKNKKKDINERISEIRSKIEKIDKGIIVYNDKLTELLEKLAKVTKERQISLDNIITKNLLQEKIKYLTSSKNDIDINELQKKYNLLQDKLIGYNKLNDEYNHKLDMIEIDIDILETTFNKLDEEKKSNDLSLKRISDLEKEIKSDEDHLLSLNKIIINDKSVIKKKKKEIFDLRHEIKDIENKISNSSIIIDYLNYIKISLKDENVKQYAISSLLPFLNKQTNYYLSESGFPYSVVIDGWLDVEIKGFGVDDVGYTSLSGGERKIIDMSVQFACNDLAELQAKTIMNIKMYDEILDTSIDTKSLNCLFSLIRVKQMKMGSCEYVITHKYDIEDLIFNNYINVEKIDGFSIIKNDKEE